MTGGGAADHLTADSPCGELQIIAELGVHLAVESCDPFPLAPGADGAPNLDLPVHREFQPLPTLTVTQACPPYRLAGAEVNLLPLVVEPGTAVDMVEVLHGELEAA